MVSERGLPARTRSPRRDAGDDRSDRLDAAQCADFCVRPADRTEHEQEEDHEEQTLSDARDEDDRVGAAEAPDPKGREHACGSAVGGVGDVTRGCRKGSDENGRHDVGHDVDRHDQSQAADGEQHAAERSADEPAEVLVQPDERVRGDEPVGVDQVGQKRVLGGFEECAERRVDEDDGIHEGQRRLVLDEDERHERESLSRVHDGHQPAPVESAGESRRQRGEQYPGHELEQECDRGSQRRAGQLEHHQRQGDEQHPIADVGDETRDPEPAKGREGERAA